MAARYRKIDPRIWTDEKFRRLTAEEQRITLYVLTAPQCNRIGLFSFSPGKAAEDLGTLPPTFQKGFENVCRTLRWEWDPEARVIYLPTWWKYNPPENQNVLIGNLKDLDDLPETPLLERFSANTAYLSEGLAETFTQTLAKRSPERSPKRSANQEQEQEQEQEQKQDAPSALEREFDRFWETYPTRDGKRLGKGEAMRKFRALAPADRQLVLVATRHYAASSQVRKGIGIKDPHRFLRSGKGDEPWREWLTPDVPSQRPARALTCTKRLPNGRFLRACGEPADARSRPSEPRCPKHYPPSLGQELHHADH
jgi:hypothetical protein